MSYKSHEEIEHEYTEVLGPEFGPYFHALYVDVVWLEDKWREFRELYGTSEPRVELLNASAPYFFGMLYDALFENLLLHISRLTDKATMGRNENVSVLGLSRMIADADFRRQVVDLAADAAAKCDFARDWRNRHIAHRDRSLALDASAVELAFASRAAIRDAIDSLSALIVKVYEKYFEGSLSLDIAGTPGDAVSLLEVLADGVAAGNERERYFQRGEMPPDWLLSRAAI